jgi:hypothetical protein
MTLKREEVRAQELAIRFLEDLVDGKYRRTPGAVKEEAARRLRHIASPATVERGSVNGPDESE